MNALYSRIENLCKSQGINISEMCRRANVARGNLTDLKMGRQNSLSAPNLMKIAGVFGLSVEQLLGEENKKSPTPEGVEPLSEARIKLLEATANMSEEEVLAMIELAEAAKRMRGDR